MSFSTIITDMRSKRIPVIRKPLLNQESDFTLDNLETKPTVWKCLSALIQIHCLAVLGAEPVEFTLCLFQNDSIYICAVQI